MGRFRETILAILVAAAPVWAAPPFPDAKRPAPAPLPPPPQPGGTIDLKAGRVYVIDSKVDGALLTYPKELVKVTKRKGPLTIDGVFADAGTGEEETRDFAGPVIYVVKALPGQSGRLDMLFVPFGFTDPKQVVTESITVNGGEAPRPAPIPDPKPVPTNGTGEWVIVIANESMPNNAAQGKVIDGPTLTKYKQAGRCRVYGATNDADKIAKQNYDKVLANAGVSAPAVIVLDGKGVPVLAQALPTEEAQLADILKGAMKP